MAEEKVSVEISKEAYEKAKKLAEESGFDSVEALIEFLIEEASSGLEEGEPLSKEDEEKIKERLKDLGYI
ncbi:MAG: CopG family transcriptional regulator [Desulfurococcales archaeon]|nr:CopG family transcriptional regulator [Desulfurococcales archaeon]